MSDRAVLGGWLLAVVLAVAVLQTTGGGVLAPPPLTDPGAWPAWLGQREPLVAAFALLRLGCLAVAWYLLVMSGVGTALRLIRARRLVAVADRLTVPALRRLLVAAAGLSLASGISPTVALAFGPQPPAAVAGAPHQPVAAAGLPLLADTASTTTTTTPDGRPPPTITMRLLPPSGETSPSPPAVIPEEPLPSVVEPAPDTWTVRPGECFWSIAEDVLTRTWGRAVTDAEIVPYWRTLIEANRSQLADPGNPDLIYPAQVFTVPAPPAG